MPEQLSTLSEQRVWPKRPWAIAAGVGVLLAGGVLLAVVVNHGFRTASGGSTSAEPHLLKPGLHAAPWWEGLPRTVQDKSFRSGETSNIHPPDYAGPQACQHCHQQNYEAWSQHPHRWMNALASAATVKGDFSGKASIAYRGGRGTFYRQADKFCMRLERGEMRRTYEIHQTIGSRFYQYYVGTQIDGPEPKSHVAYVKDHVLPFGYWLDHQEWVPTVHVDQEFPDELRADPFARERGAKALVEYASGCNACHTTFPLGDMFGRAPDTIGANAPLQLHWLLRDYLKDNRPNLLASLPFLNERNVRRRLSEMEASKYAVTLGISCEACHLGAKAHAESDAPAGNRPRFFPASPHLFVESPAAEVDFGRNHANVNWACGRCHTGHRPQFAAGMSTWNSTEYADAMRGSCYSKLACIDCHNPHRATGPKWQLTADQDDAVCIKCHDHLQPAAQRRQHTHHASGSAGARCMNCHMPRINEGLNDVVRTHMIYSPTRADMIEANHPNACNLCHTDRPIDWTLDNLQQWYGRSYDREKIAARYPERTRPAALGWLRSEDSAVRLVAAEALCRARDFKALPQLIDALDDSYLLNRQFAYKELEAMLRSREGDFRFAEVGYRFFMTSDERRPSLAALRARFAGDKP